MESYAAVRRFVFVEGRSQREAARVFCLSRETVAKMCRFSLPPGYTRTKPVGNATDTVAYPTSRHLGSRRFSGT